MAGLRELMARPDEYRVTVLARDSRVNRRKLHPWEERGVRVVWGDLLDPAAVAEGVREADVVLHVGGMVSPAADWNPRRTLEVNVGSMRLIVDAVRRRPDADSVKVVYIGSVSQYGDRLPPRHCGRVGDRLGCARFDAYAQSKIEAELVLADSGLRRWVSLRQTAILHPGLLSKSSDPITFHVPLRGAIEWVSVEDSGRLLERVCRPDVPETFWRDFYNVGGGPGWRLTNYEFECGLMAALGCPPPERVFDARWFATGNFHGIWFEDSDRLDSILHYRSGEYTAMEYFGEMSRRLPFYYRGVRLVPARVMKWWMGRVARTPGLGPLWWRDHGVDHRIEAAFGGREAWDRLPGWEGTVLERPAEPRDTPNPSPGNPDCRPVSHRCAEGHTFMVSPWSVERGGHWCPECLRRAVWGDREPGV